MAYEFVRAKDFVEYYVVQNPDKAPALWIENLGDAVNESGKEVVSVGYDSNGDPMTLLLRTS